MKLIENHPFKSALVFSCVTSILGVLIISIRDRLFSPEAILLTAPISFIGCFGASGISFFSEKLKRGKKNE